MKIMERKKLRLSKSRHIDKKAKNGTLERPTIKGWGQKRRGEKTRLTKIGQRSKRRSKREWISDATKTKTGKLSAGLLWSWANERFVDNSEARHSTGESGHYRIVAKSALLLDKKIGEHRSRSAPWFLPFSLKEH